MPRSKRFRRPEIVTVRKMTDQECQTYFGKTLEEARSEREAMEAHNAAFADRCSEPTIRVTYRIAVYDS